MYNLGYFGVRRESLKDAVVCEGMMHWKDAGFLSSSWLSQYFVIRGTNFYHYVNRGDRHPKTIINLKMEEFELRPNDGEEERDFCFEVVREGLPLGFHYIFSRFRVAFLNTSATFKVLYRRFNTDASRCFSHLTIRAEHDVATLKGQTK
jgi:hypothetical protein